MSDTVGDTELAIVDIIVIVLYFALVLFVGLWVSYTKSYPQQICGTSCNYSET